jgi:hypothetical protein
MKPKNKQPKTKQTGYKLFLEDSLKPTDVYSGVDAEGWIVVSSVEEASNYVKQNGMPFFISLNSELSLKFVLWLVQEHFDERIKGRVPGYKVHTDGATKSTLETRLNSWKEIVKAYG